MLQTCQSGMVANHHSCGAGGTSHAITSTSAVQIAPAANGTRQATARAAVRRASVPGAVPMASIEDSVDRVRRAVATRLVRPMKKAGMIGIASRSLVTRASFCTWSQPRTPNARTTPSRKTG